MSVKELKLFTDKEFARLVPSLIGFVHVTTTVNNKKRRRGNYRFEFVLKEMTSSEDVPFIEHHVRVDLVAQQPAFFFGQLFSSDEEDLLKTGKPILTYLENCPRKKGQRNTAIVKDPSVLNAGRMMVLKRKICEIFMNMEAIKRKSNGLLFFNDSEATGTYNITIYEPETVEV